MPVISSRYFGSELVIIGAAYKRSSIDKI
jgi:hypothetical protein